MIYVTKEVAVNAAGHPRLHRGDVWKGLVMKAENALPFVPGMAKCDVVERTANGLTRDIMFRGEAMRIAAYLALIFIAAQYVVTLRVHC